MVLKSMTQTQGFVAQSPPVNHIIRLPQQGSRTRADICMLQKQKNLLKAGWVETNGYDKRQFVLRERKSLRRKLSL